MSIRTTPRFERKDREREMMSMRPSDVITYQASPELRAELEAKIDKKLKELQEEQRRSKALSGSLAKNDAPIFL